MIKKETEVKTIKVSAFCECGGEFEFMGTVLMSYPPQYPHVCNKCGKSENFMAKYPTIEYREVEVD